MLPAGLEIHVGNKTPNSQFCHLLRDIEMCGGMGEECTWNMLSKLASKLKYHNFIHLYILL